MAMIKDTKKQVAKEKHYFLNSIASFQHSSFFCLNTFSLSLNHISTTTTTTTSFSF